MDFPLFDLVFTLSILTSATLLLKDVFGMSFIIENTVLKQNEVCRNAYVYF